MIEASWPEHRLRVGPFAFLVRSPLQQVITEVADLYRDYPSLPMGEVVDYTVAVHFPTPLRRFYRPKLVLSCDVEVPEMAPQPVSHGLLALEMGLNLQIAVGMHRLLLLHAGAVARGGEALILTGESGAGKSTLAAILGHSGWRFLGDEFALVDLSDAQLRPFPRPISLKNDSIALLEAIAPRERFGPRFDGTFKGSIRHLAPPEEAIAAMDEPARPRLVVVPRFQAGAETLARPMTVSETFVRLTQSSTNYRRLGEQGFVTAWSVAEGAPGYEIFYGSSEAAIELVDQLWAIHG
jgi:HprK-related kinase A